MFDSLCDLLLRRAREIVVLGSAAGLLGASGTGCRCVYLTRPDGTRVLLLGAFTHPDFSEASAQTAHGTVVLKGYRSRPMNEPNATPCTQP
jgi:hypothetical protein